MSFCFMSMHAFLTDIPATTSVSDARRSGVCVKCGSIKVSGKYSCCARGGSWFKKCGDVGDTKLDHTWTEGIQACKSFGNSDTYKPPIRFMVHLGGITYPLNTTQSRNATKQHATIGRAGSMSNEFSASSKDRFELAKVAVYIFGLFVSSHLTFIRSNEGAADAE